MATSKIRCNDKVIILTGKDKGKQGTVKLISSDKKKAVVSGVNFIKKHQKPIPSKNQPGGIIKKESFIDLSNVAIFNSILNKADRVRFTICNGKKVRVFKSNGNMIK